MDFASWKDRKSVAQALRTVYRAADAAAGQAASTPSRKGRGVPPSSSFSTPKINCPTW